MFQNSCSFEQFFSSSSFFLMTYAEIKAFYWLKAFFLLKSAKNKRILQKELIKRTAFSGHVNQIILPQLDIMDCWFWITRLDVSSTKLLPATEKASQKKVVFLILSYFAWPFHFHEILLHQCLKHKILKNSQKSKKYSTNILTSSSNHFSKFTHN